MHYSYGDSSTSPFTSNFLELLRDAIDFAVYVLEADQRIFAIRARSEAVQRRSDAELVELDALKIAVLHTIVATPKGAANSPASECATRLTAACDETVRGTASSVKKNLAADLAQTEAEEAAERDGCVATLLNLLVPHAPPGASSGLRLRWRQPGGYAAILEGTWPAIGLTWKCAPHAPRDQPFDHALRVETLLHGLEIDAPEAAGWIRKEVRIRTQSLGRHVITEAAIEGTKVTIGLRMEPNLDAGFDFESDLLASTVTAARVDAGDGAIAAGPFELDAADSSKLLDLCKIVRNQLAKLKPTRITDARVGDCDFRALPQFAAIAEPLIEYLAPFVNDIARHSLEPDELVLRRPLGDDRREEIFVSKLTLREKYDHLPAEQRAPFLKLGLHGTLSRSMRPEALADPTTRSELPPSNPPPPPVRPLPPLPPVPRIAMNPAPLLNPTLPAQAAEPATPAIPPKSDAAAAPASSSKSEPGELSLAPALKKIVELGKAGRLDDAFNECAAVLDEPSFGSHNPTEQRHALRLLFVLERPAVPSDVVRRAHRSGRRRASAMVERSGDPADYELLGLCQAALDETAAAALSFKKGLDIERARNPNSDLCARLTKHAS